MFLRNLAIDKSVIRCGSRICVRGGQPIFCRHRAAESQKIGPQNGGPHLVIKGQKRLFIFNSKVLLNFAFTSQNSQFSSQDFSSW